MAGFMKLQVCPNVENGNFEAYYSAPGYLDRTDSVEAETPEQAAREAFSMYGDDEEKGTPDRNELAEVLRMIRKARREGRI